MRNCGECGAEVEEAAAACPRCGAALVSHPIEDAVGYAKAATPVDGLRVHRTTPSVPRKGALLRAVRSEPSPRAGLRAGAAPAPASATFPAEETGTRARPEPVAQPTGAQVLPFPRRDGTPTGATRESTGRITPRPPVLASESLRRELVPIEPEARPARVASITLGGLAAMVALALGGLAAWPAVLLGGAAIAVGIAPLGYQRRAAAGAAVGGLGVLACVVLAGTRVDVLRVLACVVLGASLQVRAAYRGTLGARIGVAVGLVLGVVWLGTTAPLGALFAVEPLGPFVIAAVSVALAGVLVASLLAFTGASSTAGGGATARVLFVWLGVLALTELAVASGGALDAARSAATAGLVCAPMFAWCASSGLFQLVAVRLGGTRSG